MTNEMNQTAVVGEGSHDDCRHLSAFRVLVVTTSIFIPLTLFVGMIGARLPGVLSPVAYLVFPFIPAIVFPLAAIPVALVWMAAAAVAIRKGSLTVLATTSIALSIINGIGLRLYLNYLALPT